ncbi:globin-coupled sensor protein [Paenibacillus sp. SC116]|uniref:globin-coupled sensor protein n=1 Tax=Paenibacillus sp. SC116 TaxID=2968986 RepID=UPI00215AE4D8|nr:globin-coupled sensor protein [Paenibacillus sp. SC116]MCR8846707.1 globin-coupled sensor protein [Paenibacillus sp. SC116]
MFKRWGYNKDKENDFVTRNDTIDKWDFDLEQADKEGSIQFAKDHKIWSQLDMIQLTTNDLGMLHLAQPYLLPWLDEISEAFYASVLQVESLKQMINQHSSVEKLRVTLRKHIEEMFDGLINEAYVEKRMRIAAIHYRIGLEPKWYMGAFQKVQAVVFERLMLHAANPKLAIQVVHSFNKVLNLEQQLVLEFFEMKRQQAEKEHIRQKDQLHKQISKLSEQLASLSVRTNDAIQEMVSYGIELNNSTQQTANSSIATQRNAEEGKKFMNELTVSIQQIDVDMQQVEQHMSALKMTTEHIASIAQSIIAIADHTHLLSLNASIEAAHAGDRGAGFSIVAKEVNKLAVSTKQTVNNIENLIINSTEVTKTVVDVISAVQNNAGQVRTNAELTMEKFSNIVTGISESASQLNIISNSIQSLSDAIQSISESTEQVASSAEQLNRISSI